MGKKTNQKRQSTMLSAILSGTAVSVALALIGAAITAWAISSGKAGQNKAQTAAWIILFLSSAVGTWFATKMTERKKLQTAIIAGGAFLLVLLIMTAVLFDGHYSGVWIGAVLTMTASLATTMLSLKQGRSVKKKQWKRPYR